VEIIEKAENKVEIIEKADISPKKQLRLGKIYAKMVIY